MNIEISEDIKNQLDLVRELISERKAKCYRDISYEEAIKLLLSNFGSTSDEKEGSE